MKKILSVIITFATLVNGFSQKHAVLITSFGAKPDGVTNNTIAIQRAIDEVAGTGGGIVMVPRGRFVTGVIHLKTNVELNIYDEAVLLGSTNRADYGAGNKASALIVAENEKNISITGKGTIDGQCDLLINDIYIKLRAGELQDDEWKELNPLQQRRPSENNRPCLINFRNCDGIAVKNIHIQNGTGWVQTYQNCINIIIDSIDVFSNTYWNNDGIDLVDCKNARVTNCNINSADDGICLKSEDRNNYCDNIYIANCRIRSSANALKLGTSSQGGFKNVVIRNIEVYDTYRSAIAIETVDGGLIDGIDARNINAVNTGNAILIRLGHRNKDSVVSRLRNVYIANVKVQVPKGKPDKGYPMEAPGLKYPSGHKIDTTIKYQSVSPWNNSGVDSSAIPYPHNVFPSSITGLPLHYVENVTLENIEIIYEGGASKDVNYFPADSLQNITEAISDYPEFSMFGELPCWGFYVRHVKGLTMKNIKLSYIQPDFRTACIFDDVNKLKLDSFSVSAYENLPVIILNNVKEISLNKLKLPAEQARAIKFNRITE